MMRLGCVFIWTQSSQYTNQLLMNSRANAVFKCTYCILLVLDTSRAYETEDVTIPSAYPSCAPIHIQVLPLRSIRTAKPYAL